MYHIQVTRKNCFNKPRALKAQLLEQVIAALPTQSFPNGNSGYNSYYARPMIQYFGSCIVREVGGDPHTPNYVLLDAGHLTSEQVERIQELLKPVEGTNWSSVWASFMAIAKKQTQPWVTLSKLINGSADQSIVKMYQIGLDNDKTSKNRWVRKHTTFNAAGKVLQVGYADEINQGFEYIFDGWCLYNKEDVQFKPATDKYRAEWRLLPDSSWLSI